MAVCFAVEGVAYGSQFHVGDVLQAQYGAVGIGAYDDVLKLGHLFQAALVLERILIVVVDAFAVGAVDGLLAQLSGRRLQVLLSQGIGNVTGHDVVLSHQFRLHPDAQRVCAAQQHHVAHAFHTLNLRDDIDVEVVRDEVLVVLAVLAAQRVNLQEGGLPLDGGDADSRHLLWQQSLHTADAVLHVDGSHVGVGALLEDDVDGGRAGIGGGTAYVEHVLHAVDAFFQGLDDGFHDGIGTGTCIGGAHGYGWRSDVGELLQG